MKMLCNRRTHQPSRIDESAVTQETDSSGSVKAAMNPIVKDPVMFTTSVPRGKVPRHVRQQIPIARIGPRCQVRRLPLPRYNRALKNSFRLEGVISSRGLPRLAGTANSIALTRGYRIFVSDQPKAAAARIQNSFVIRHSDFVILITS